MSATYTVGALLVLLVGHLSENGYRSPKEPITPVRAATKTINRLDKPKTDRHPAGHAVNDTDHHSSEEHFSNTDPPANRGDPLYPGQE